MSTIPKMTEQAFVRSAGLGCVILLCFGLSGCATTHVIPPDVDPAESVHEWGKLVSGKPARVWLTSGEVLDINVTGLVDDAIEGTNEAGEEVSVALEDVEKVRVSDVKTGVIRGSVIYLLLVAISILFAGW